MALGAFVNGDLCLLLSAAALRADSVSQMKQDYCEILTCCQGKDTFCRQSGSDFWVLTVFWHSVCWTLELIFEKNNKKKFLKKDISTWLKKIFVKQEHNAFWKIPFLFSSLSSPTPAQTKDQNTPQNNSEIIFHWFWQIFNFIPVHPSLVWVTICWWKKPVTNSTHLIGWYKYISMLIFNPSVKQLNDLSYFFLFKKKQFQAKKVKTVLKFKMVSFWHI